jgi:hypothetical protein
MLHDLLSKYLQDVEVAVQELANVYVERYEEEILRSSRINLRIRIRFSSGHLLELNEAVIIETDHIRHLNYRYHLQDEQNRLVFRYDNAPHFRNLSNFPHHKHLDNDVISCQQPSILQAIEEARQLA